VPHHALLETGGAGPAWIGQLGRGIGVRLRHAGIPADAAGGTVPGSPPPGRGGARAPAPRALPGAAPATGRARLRDPPCRRGESAPLHEHAARADDQASGQACLPGHRSRPARPDRRQPAEQRVQVHAGPGAHRAGVRQAGRLRRQAGERPRVASSSSTTTATLRRAWPRSWRCTATTSTSHTTASKPSRPRPGCGPRSSCSTSACLRGTGTKPLAGSGRQGSDGVLLVAVTGWGQDEARRLSHEVGFDAHLVKPVTLDAITNLLPDVEAARPRRGQRK
jgi:hypothetical protein